MGKTLLKGGCVLSLDRKVGNFRVADVLIDGDRVAEVGPDVRARGAEVIDAADTIVMPGFVDAHRHLCESLFRGLGDRAVADTSHYTPDDVYAATLVGLLGAAEAGITTVVDWAELFEGEHVGAALQAHADCAMRTVFVQTSTLPGSLKSDAGQALVGLAAGPASVDHWQEARALGLRIHAHAGDGTEAGRADVMGPMLAGDVTLIHCSGFGDSDLDTVGSSGASIVLTPSSEMTAGIEPLQVQKLVDRGIRPGLGIDTEIRGPGDLFAQMRAVISLQHATLFDLKLAGKAGIPKLLTTREVIRYATVDGARSIGLGDVTGSLTPGKQADLVVLKTDRPNIFPINDPIGAVVWGMDTSNVDWVFVAGVPVKREGELVADVGVAREAALVARERVLTAGGAPVGVIAGVEGGAR
jgi:cytosine/adenosine deaminase-related metal-dependent hydrolase